MLRTRTAPRPLAKARTPSPPGHLPGHGPHDDTDRRYLLYCFQESGRSTVGILLEYVEVLFSSDKTQSDGVRVADNATAVSRLALSWLEDVAPRVSIEYTLDSGTLNLALWSSCPLDPIHSPASQFDTLYETDGHSRSPDRDQASGVTPDDAFSRRYESFDS